MLENSIRNSRGNITPADPWDFTSKVVHAVKCPSSVQISFLSMPTILADNVTFPLPTVGGQYNPHAIIYMWSQNSSKYFTIFSIESYL